MKKLLTLIIAILTIMLNSSWITVPTTSTSSSSSTSTTTHSSVDEDFENMNLKYTADEKTIVDLIFFAEFKDDKVGFLYFYDKDSYLTESLILKMSIKSSAMLEDLEAQENKTFNTNLNLISTSNNFKKYQIDLKNYSLNSYRKYEFTQVISRALNYPISKEYYYYENENNETKYEYSNIQVIEITNQIMYEFLINESSSLENFFNIKNGSSNYFIGFNTNLKIEDLIEVDVTYKYQTISGIKKSYASNYFNAMPPLSDYDNTPSNWRDYAIKYGEIFEASTTLKGEIIESSNNNLFKKEKMKWKNIESYKSLSSNKSEALSTFAKENLSAYSWIINIAQYDYFYKDGAIIQSSFYKNLYDYLGSENDTNLGRRAHIASGTYVSKAEIMRLKFETDGNIYDLSVISVPVDSSGSISPDLPDEVNNIIDWIANVLTFFGIDKPSANGIAIFIVIFLCLTAVAIMFSILRPIVEIGKVLIVPKNKR